MDPTEQTTRRPLRFDRAVAPTRCERTDNGWLRAPARLTRIGVFPYVRADGTIRRELRLPDEVFRPDALRSFSLVPVTDDHPPEPHGLTADNAAKYARGAVGENVIPDGEFVAASLLITDAALVAKVDGGKVELSCGYFCDLDETPGTHPVFGPYDVIQRNIAGNHVAVVDVGRAGPEARIKLDSADAEMVLSDPESSAKVNNSPQERETMRKVVIDGIEFEVSEQVAQALGRKFTADAAQLEKVRADVAQVKAEADKARADATAAKVEADKASARADAAEKARTDAADPARFNAAVSERVELLAKAREVIGADFKADGLDARGIRAAVITKIDPAVKLDGKSDDYVSAFYDAQIKTSSKAGDPTVTRVDGAAPGAPINLADRKAKFDEAMRGAHAAKR